VETQSQGALRPGDIVLFAGRSFRARLVNFFQSLFAKSGASLYNHAAVVTSGHGAILHATRWRIKYTSLKRCYRRSQVLVVRWRHMTQERFRLGMTQVGPMLGRPFAFWRQVLHALRLGWLSWGEYVVCSELVAKFLAAVGAWPRHWAGVNVNDLYEEFMENPSQYWVVFRGRLMDFF
jgi:hypothetical protein